MDQFTNLSYEYARSFVLDKTTNYNNWRISKQRQHRDKIASHRIRWRERKLCKKFELWQTSQNSTFSNHSRVDTNHRTVNESSSQIQSTQRSDRLFETFILNLLVKWKIFHSPNIPLICRYSKGKIRPQEEMVHI